MASAIRNYRRESPPEINAPELFREREKTSREIRVTPLELKHAICFRFYIFLTLHFGIFVLLFVILKFTTNKQRVSKENSR